MGKSYDRGGITIWTLQYFSLFEHFP